ncbi:MAG: PilZ domain-containing protein [Nitrospirae bacterium]|nr:PilZ domain-containing protein [Nitrospirota bacterium]
MAVRQNCWEFNKCGREVGGKRSGETGVCPSAVAASCSGLYHGKNGGRMCWAIAGTFAAGKIRGSFAREFSCLNCDFLKSVCKEEDICNFKQLTPYRIYNDSSRMFGRRRFMRLDAYLDMTINPGKHVSSYGIIGVSINFCREGFSFISENFEPTPPGPIEFRMQLPRTDKCTRASGDVAWKTKVRDRCFAGVKITYLDDQDKREILDYSYDRWIEGVRFH